MIGKRRLSLIGLVALMMTLVGFYCPPQVIASPGLTLNKIFAPHLENGSRSGSHHLQDDAACKSRGFDVSHPTAGSCPEVYWQCRATGRPWETCERLRQDCL